jgi:hypothetical protein
MLAPGEGMRPAMINAPRIIDRPEPGYWLARFAKGGPLYPCAIVFRAVEHEPGNPDNDMRGTRSPTLVGMIGRRVVDPVRVWHCSPEREIDAREFDFRCADAEWLERYAPHDPAGQAFERVDFMRTRF